MLTSTPAAVRCQRTSMRPCGVWYEHETTSVAPEKYGSTITRFAATASSATRMPTKARINHCA